LSIERYTSAVPVRRVEQRAHQDIQRLALANQVEQARLHTVAAATQFAMVQYVQVKRLQNDLEKLCPDATEGLAVLANNAVFSLARQLQQFENEVRW
jgi:hypothetical protein